MNKLTDLPNIGPTLEKKLMDAGITSAEKLKKLGSEQAFLRIASGDNKGCFNMICALEGAIRGIRWHKLPEERMTELKRFLGPEQAGI